MSVLVTFWEHINFVGFQVSWDSKNYRYYSVNYGTAHNDEFSSMRAWDAGNRGNVYAFEHANYRGRYACLNVGGGYSSAWYYNFGSAFNDVVSSSIIVAREPKLRETEIALKGSLKSQFERVFGYYIDYIDGVYSDREDHPRIERMGNAVIFPNFFPHYNSKSVFVRIEHNLRVTPSSFFGYLAANSYVCTVKFDVQFSVQTNKIHADVSWFWVEVESGQFSQMIANDLVDYFGPMVQSLGAAVTNSLQMYSNIEAVDAYLLPGGPPDMDQAAAMGNFDDDITLVIVARQ
jgi:hypothetical protein